jgi:hypothetical protein
VVAAFDYRGFTGWNGIFIGRQDAAEEVKPAD